MGSVFPQAGPFPVLVLTGDIVCERCPIIDFAADVFDLSGPDLGVFFLCKRR